MLVAGIIGVVAAIFLDSTPDKKLFWGAYHYGFIFWMTLTLGCTTLTFLHHTIRAQWSLSLLRIVEAGNKTLWLMGLLFLPIAITTVFFQGIFPWANDAFRLQLHVNKQTWLNPYAWLGRAVFYFAVWIFTTRRMNKSSLAQDTSLDENLAERRRSEAAPLGVLHVILLTFAMTDWLMSLNPGWLSTLYGAWHMTTGVLATISFGTVLILSMRDRRPFSDAVNPVLTKDLGNMMLGFTMIFGYFTLSQFLIIWSGNLPEEIVFFVQRFEGPLVFVGLAIVVCQFFGPFLALLSGKAKRTPELLIKVAAWIFFFRIVDIWWQVLPFFKSASQLWSIWMDLGAFLLVGGVWIVAFVRNLKQHSLLPLHDSRLQETKAALEAH